MRYEDLMSQLRKINSRERGEDLIELKEARLTHTDGQRVLDVRGTQYSIEGLWPFTQLCRKLNIPVRFLLRNSPGVQETIINHWLPRISNATSSTRVKYWENGNKILRAVLPSRFRTLSNLSIVESLQDLVRDEGLELERASGIDGKVFYFRMLLPTPVTFLDPLKFGISIVGSEVGAHRLEVNNEIFRLVCSNGMKVSYGGRAFFTHDYAGGLDEGALSPIMNSAMARLQGEGDTIVQKLETSLTNISEGNRVEQLRRDLKSKLSQCLWKECEAELTEANNLGNPWEVVNCVTRIAQKYDIPNRMRAENVVGKLLGVDLTGVAT